MSRTAKVLVVLLMLAGMLVMSAVLVLQLPTFGGEMSGERLARMQRSPEYVDGRFVNKPPYESTLALWQNIRDYAGGQVRTPPFAIPVVPLVPGSLRLPPVAGLRAIWFGHATVLLEIDGVRIITDPMLSQRASPFQFLGPERMHPPPIALAQLEGIDAAVISHDHYDHLDMATVLQLARGGTHFFVGLGVGAHLERWGVPRCRSTRWTGGRRSTSRASRSTARRRATIRAASAWTTPRCGRRGCSRAPPTRSTTAATQLRQDESLFCLNSKGPENPYFCSNE